MIAQWDVVIAGAGPCGSYVGGRLSEAGLRVLVLEKKVKKGLKACTGIVGVEAFERFPLPKSSILSEVRSIRIFSPSKRSLTYRSNTPLAYVCDRSTLDESMVLWAEERGITLRRGVKVLCAERRSSHLEIRIRDLVAAKEDRAFARLLVVASGYSPSLLFSLGLGPYGGTVEGAQAIVAVRGGLDCLLPDGPEVYVGRNVAPSGFAWAVPVDSSTARIGVITNQKAHLFLRQFLSSLPYGQGASIRLARKTIPDGPIAKTFGDRMLVVGEAAGQLKATTYGGIYYGLLSSEHAVDTIIEAFHRGDLSEKMLSSYEEAWRKTIGGEILLQSFFRKRLMGMDDAGIDRLFAILGRDGLISKLSSVIRFDWHGDIISLLRSILHL